MLGHGERPAWFVAGIALDPATLAAVRTVVAAVHTAEVDSSLAVAPTQLAGHMVAAAVRTVAVVAPSPVVGCTAAADQAFAAAPTSAVDSVADSHMIEAAPVLPPSL